MTHPKLIAQPTVGAADQRSVRRHNMGLVLRLVADRGPVPRGAISAETGLVKTSVSSIIADLAARGLVAEVGSPSTGAVGRPARLLQLSGERVVALGLDLGVDAVTACAVDLSGRVRYHDGEAVENRDGGPEEAIARLAALSRRMLAEVRSRGMLPVGATVAVPGPVARERGLLLSAPNLHWGEVPVVEKLRADLGEPNLPLRLDNEANLAAFGELKMGVGRGLRNFVLVFGEIGVGGGIVINGEVYGGAGASGEFGHITLDAEGRRCGCGARGCLETFVGREALLERAGLSIAEGRDPHEAVALLAERARNGEPLAREALWWVGRWLGIGLSSTANLLNPEAIVLAGYFAELAEWLEEPILAEMRERVIAMDWSAPIVRPAALGWDAVVRGAAARVLEDVLLDPSTVEPMALAS